MTFGLSGSTIAALAVGGAGLASGYMASQAAKSAAGAQAGAANSGIAEQQREFNALQQLLAPFVSAGTGALGAQQNLLGLNGAAAQQAAISNLQNQPYFQSQLKLGQNAILQNASATGGLRGGNTQGALAYFAPSLLAQTVQQQYGNLGGIAGMGENAAAMTGNAGMQMGNNITSLLGQIGSAQAGNALAQGQIGSNVIGSLLSAFGIYQGGGGMGPWSGGQMANGGLQPKF